MSTKEYILAQCARYPALEVQDLLKALHQSVFGPGHFVTDEARCAELLETELTAPGVRADAEPLDGDYVRLHLAYLKENGLAARTLLRLFLRSAETGGGTVEELERKILVLLELAREGQIPVSEREMTAAVEKWRRDGYPACRHSEGFRKAYRPAYRVLSREYLWLLPLLATIDRTLAQKGRAMVALEGGAGSGKSTLAALLEALYGCTVFHMDDYFLRPEQRTAARLAEPGGNVDYERFSEEILRPLTKGEDICYRPYDCRTQTLQDSIRVTPKALTVVEGAYSMHPTLAGHYDLSAFLRIDPALQRRRIEKRSGRELAERFFSEWIPLEQRYFAACAVETRCDLILEVEA